MKQNIITFIGMSGVGKSYWSEKFAKEGYEVFHIDDLISEKLGEIINKENGDGNVDYGKSLVGGLAKWMGFPGDKRYEKNCKTYLKLEEKITLQSLNKTIKNNKPAIIDTTGSVIYLSSELKSKLKKHTKIVYLDISKSKLSELFETFCKFPKPIIWNGKYKALKNETEEKTLARCYKNLLDFRINKYEKLAHKIISYTQHHKNNLSTQGILKNK